MTARHTSSEERIRHLIESSNFEDEHMRKLGESGTIDDIRKHAVHLSPVVSLSVSDPTVTSDPPALTREQKLALLLIDTIDRLARIDKVREEEAARRPIRRPSEMDGITPLTRATFEGGRENL
jgi:hypothetical protein